MTAPDVRPKPMDRGRPATELLSKDEVRRITVNIVKLLELLSRDQTWGVRRDAILMSAFGGKADISRTFPDVCI